MIDYSAVRGALTELGFHPQPARQLARCGEWKLPLSKNIRSNAQLLRRYIDFSVCDVFTDESAAAASLRMEQIAAFLRRPHSVNVLMASIPERYGFSDAERDAYNRDPLSWSCTEDLRTELDAALSPFIPDSETREAIYRSIYCDGIVIGLSEDVRRACTALQDAAVDMPAMSAFLLENWRLLFSAYADVEGCLRTLTELFGRENAPAILMENPLLPRLLREDAFTSFDPFDTRGNTLRRLCERYAPLLKDAAPQ